MNLAATVLGLDVQTWLGIAIGALISLAISMVIYRLQKSPRTLDYAITSMQDFTNDANPHLPTRMSVIWHEEGESYREGQCLKKPRIVSYRIKNTGKRAIDADDFKEPIKVEAATGSIVDVRVIAVSHPGVHALGSILSNSSAARTFTPRLMNPKDSISIQVITEKCPEPPKVTCWMREESRPMQRRQDILDPSLLEVAKKRVKYGGSLVLLALMFGLLGLVVSFPMSSTIALLAGGVVVATVCVVVVYSIILTK